jgi:hypothetical protein
VSGPKVLNTKEAIVGLRDFKTDKKAEQEGIWIHFAGVCKILCKRAGQSNKKFQKAFQKSTRPHRHNIENDTVDNDIIVKILASLYVDYLILEWQTWKPDIDHLEGGTWEPGIESPEDETEIVPATKELMVRQLIEAEELFDAVRAESTKASNFRAASREEDSEN